MSRAQSPILWAGLLTALVLACARALPPPGGPPDELAPRIIATSPEPLGTLTDTSAAVVFRFAERISERGFQPGMVLVSPRTSEPRVERSGSEIRVRMEGGWRRNEVYRLVLQPGVRDLFGNEVENPAELVFTTGAEIVPTAVAGLVIDRITGAPAPDAIIEATRQPDSLVYSTVPDTAAFFALRFLPVGNYQVRAFNDRNRNGRLEPNETLSATTQIALAQASDTVPIALNLVPQDTTPARLTGAIATDSLEVRLSFDDYLDSDEPLDSIDARLFTLPDTVPVGGVSAELRWAVIFDLEKRARADSIAAAARAAADSAAADSAAAAGDTTNIPPGGRGGAGRGGPPTGRGLPPPGARAGLPGFRAGGPQAAGGDSDVLLPSREIVLVPGEPLTPGGSYLVRIMGAINVTRVVGGGGAAAFDVPERPDSTGLPGPDTLHHVRALEVRRAPDSDDAVAGRRR